MRSHGNTRSTGSGLEASVTVRFARANKTNAGLGFVMSFLNQSGNYHELRRIL